MGTRGREEPRSLRFIEVSPESPRLSWLSKPESSAPESAPPAALSPPEVTSHPLPPLSPIADSLPPPQKPSAPPPTEPTEATPPPPPKKPDTLIEELIPRADEEAALAIESAVRAFAKERADALESAESELVSLVQLMSRKILLRELQLDPGLLEGIVREGLAALSLGDQVTVRVGAFFCEIREDLQRRLEQTGIPCRVTLDETLGPYGCTLATRLGRVDESLDARLSALLAGLDEPFP